jgi:hypothetical protein
MAVTFALVFLTPLLLALGVGAHTGLQLLGNLAVARKIGVPVRVILFDHVNPFWLVLDRAILSLVRRLPFGLGDNSFTRYNYRGWEVPDRYYTHHELGDAYILVSSKNIWLYIDNPDTIKELWRRGNEFPRDTSVTGMNQDPQQSKYLTRPSNVGHFWSQHLHCARRTVAEAPKNHRLFLQ